ncbi:sensor histidine kinase [Methylibium rhizosphaerae]|uniref:sensor histidine kinase n=1 Tax=Methylibium rhizosphaerae TaxID=2570323 RepID=UPI001128D4DC|nr:sensor histidine kinase [Methylibium rhizosphaerae]
MTSPPREQRSLFGEILDWMLAPLLLLWPMSVALTWLVAQNIANRPYDRALGETARVLAQQVLPPAQDAPARLRFQLSTPAADLLRADEADEVYYQVLGTRGEFVSGDRDIPVPPEDEKPVVGEIRFRDEFVHGEPVRVAYLWLDGPPVAQATASRDAAARPLVQVAETLGKRSKLATEIIKGVILPQFVILPIAVLLVWLALARGISPLNELQQRIRARAADDLSPIDEREAPEEVAPLVRGINDLLGRLDRSISTQKRFLADAAHQMKTPLAGLRMQAELAQREIEAGTADPHHLAASLQQIARSSQRAARMVNQLLAMARTEDASQRLQLEPLCLASLATETVRDFVPRAMDKRIDLGYEGPDPGSAMVMGQPILLRELLGNLVDNALQYTPAGGTVTVRVVSDPFGQVVVLQVEDSGPGIPPAERDLVFQPFYRALGTNVDGSGLGLAIVSEIARRHGAELTLEDARGPGTNAPAGAGAHDGGPGARFTLRFAALVQHADSSPPPAGDTHEVHP